MKWISTCLLAVVALEVGAWLLAPSRTPDEPGKAELPRVDLSLLGDRVTRDYLRRLADSVDRSRTEDWQRLGEAYLTYGFYPQAEMCLRVAAEDASVAAQTRLPRAIALDRMGYKTAALAEYRRAIEADVRGARLFQIRIPQCLLALGEDDRAFKQLLRIARSEGTRPPDALSASARILAARIALRGGAADRTRSLLEPLQEIVPQAIEPRSLVCWASEAMGDADAAYAEQNRCLRAGANIFTNALVRQEDFRRRQEHSNKVFHDRSIELENAGRIEAARRTCEDAVQAMWEEEMVRSHALFEIHLGNAQPAIEMLEAAVRRVGGSAATFDALGDALALAGEKEAARRAWLRSTEIHARPQTHEKLAASFSSAGDAGRAQRHRGLASFAVGQAAWLDNDLRAAHAAFAVATRLAPDHAHAWFYLGETARLQGDSPAARAAYAMCLDKDPDHGRARRAARRLQPATAEAPISPGR